MRLAVRQAMTNVALAICDPGDEVVLVAPYYFSHLLALQIAQVRKGGVAF
jgi:aspartate/methionine/tyrosine aminotransferase